VSRGARYVVGNCAELLLGAEFLRRRIVLVIKEETNTMLSERTATSKNES